MEVQRLLAWDEEEEEEERSYAVTIEEHEVSSLAQ